MKDFRYGIYAMALIISLGCSSRNENRKHDLTWLKKQAREYYDKSNYSEACRAYSQLIKIDSSNGEFYFNKGFSEMALMMYDDARSDFFRAIALNYRMPSGYYNIGLTYYHDNDSLAAVFFEKCLQIDSAHEKARMLLKGLKKDPN